MRRRRVYLTVGIIVLAAGVAFYYLQKQPEESLGFAQDEPSRTITTANFGFCRELTTNNNGYTNGIATTTAGLFPLFASSTISTLAATSSGGMVQRIASSTNKYTDEPIDIVFADEPSCYANATIPAIPHYFEKYASTTGAFAVHLGTSNISSTTAKTVTMYYGYAGATNLNSPGQTFGTSSPAQIVSHWDLSVPGFATTTVADFTDSTYNANNVTSKNMNNADLITGQVDGALDLDGTNDWLEKLTPVGMPAVEARMTMSIWVKYASSAARKIAFSLVKDNSNSIDLAIGGPGVIAAETAGGAHLVSDTAPAVNVWHMITYTQTGNGVRLYFNGKLVKNGSNPATSGAVATMRIGSFNASFPDPTWVGQLDDARVYKNALDVADIQTIYNTTSKSDVFWTFGAEETLASQTPPPPPPIIPDDGEWDSDAVLPDKRKHA